MGRIEKLGGSVPWSFWAYLGGTALVVALSQIPSSVETTYTWRGAIFEFVLLIGLFRGSNLARWGLIVIGLLVALAGVLVQSTPLDPVATGLSCLAVFVSGLLLTPSMRMHTTGESRAWPRLT